MSNYEVVVTREGANWLADVPSVPGAHTFARSLAGLRQSVREAVILMADLDDDAKVDLAFRYEVDDATVREAASVGRRRQEVAQAEREVAACTKHLIGDLTSAGYSARDAAALLNVTPGRVSQLVR